MRSPSAGPFTGPASLPSQARNRSGSARDYSVHVRLGTGSSDWVNVEDVPAGGTATFTAREFGSFRDGACAVIEVRGPMPFGLDPSLFED